MSSRFLARLVLGGICQRVLSGKSVALEGQVVVVGFRLLGGLTRAGAGRRRGLAWGARLARLLAAAIAVPGFVAVAPLEVLDRVRDQLRRVALLAVLPFPLAGLDAALDVHLGALAQVLSGEL